MMNKIRIGLIVCFLLNAPGSRVDAVDTPTGTTAIAAASFLDSLGVNTHVDQGYNPKNYIAPLRYLGIHNLRDGTRNLSGYFMLHEKAAVHVDLLAGNLDDLLAAARTLAKNDVLMALEGPNEPNNWPITYKGERGGGKDSWEQVAQFQADLYRAVKDDPLLNKIPIFHVSEGGAETDNVGLQFLTIPEGAKTLFPSGTRFADFANPHNYVSGHGNTYVDNQAWQAADPTLNGRWDGLYVEYGMTWRHNFKGYSDEQLQALPRVTTETGWDSVSGLGGEKVQGTVLVDTYLAQFKRGWRYTFIYELGDGEGGDGNQGLYRKDWTPKPAANYIHNLTTILADNAPIAHPSALNYTIKNQPQTVHDLLFQKRDGVFYLVVWGEKSDGSEDVTIDLGSLRPKLRIYDVTSGVEPLSTKLNLSQITLNLTDHPMILEIE